MRIDAGLFERAPQPLAVRIVADLTRQRDRAAQPRRRAGLIAALAAGHDRELVAAQRLPGHREPGHVHDEIRVEASDNHNRSAGHDVRRLHARSAAAQLIRDRRSDDHRSRDEPPGRFLHAHLREPGAEHEHDQGAERRRYHRPASAGEAGAADDDRGDRLELESHAGVRIGGRQARRLRHRRRPRQRARDREDGDAHASRIDACQSRRLGIDADREDPPPEHDVAQKELARCNDRDREEDGSAKAAGDVDGDGVDGAAEI